MILNGRSKNPGIETVTKIARVLGVTFEALMTADLERFDDDLDQEPGWSISESFLTHELGMASTNLAIHIVGDDRIAPTIAPRSRVIVDHGHRMPKPSGIFVMEHGESLAVRRIQVLEGFLIPTIWIGQDNPGYAAIQLPLAEVRIKGQVRALIAPI